MNVRRVADRHLHERGLELAAMAIDFDLTSEETTELEAHLATCPTCAQRAAAMRADNLELGRPLTLLPSSRVDTAVYAEIARRHARPQRLVVLAAAALLLLAALLGAVAGAAYLLRTWQTPPTIVVPAPTAPVAVVTPRPDGSPVVVGAAWRTLAIPASDVGTGWIGLMEAVTVTESGFVAVGRPVCRPQNEPQECHGSVWTAAAGEGWTRAPDQPGLEVGLDVPVSGPEKGIFDVAAGPAGLVAVGNPYDQRGAGIWLSPDGRSWERVDGGATFTNATLNAVTSSADRYVIVGTVTKPAGAPAPARAAAWTSPDGLVWTRANDSAAMDAGTCVDTGETPYCGGMLAVTATVTGFVAVGESCPGTFDGCRPAAWRTADGGTWLTIDTGLDFTGRLDTVASGAPGIVAAGRQCSGSQCSGVDALSIDGATWTFVAYPGTPSDESRLASDGSVILGAAWDYDSARFLLWRTSDGLTRQLIESLPLPSDIQNVQGADIAVLGDQVVIVAWAWVEIPHDSGLPAQTNMTFQSP